MATTIAYDLEFPCRNPQIGVYMENLDWGAAPYIADYGLVNKVGMTQSVRGAVLCYYCGWKEGKPRGIEW